MHAIINHHFPVLYIQVCYGIAVKFKKKNFRFTDGETNPERGKAVALFDDYL